MGLRPAQRSTEITAEFRNEVDRDAGVHPSLAIEKLRLVIERHHRAVPHIRVQVERAAAIAPEADELLRRDIVTRQCQRHYEALALERIEELAAVGMIVGTPDEGALAQP